MLLPEFTYHIKRLQFSKAWHMKLVIAQYYLRHPVALLMRKMK